MQVAIACNPLQSYVESKKKRKPKKELLKSCTAKKQDTRQNTKIPKWCKDLYSQEPLNTK